MTIFWPTLISIFWWNKGGGRKDYFDWGTHGGVDGKACGGGTNGGSNWDKVGIRGR